MHSNHSPQRRPIEIVPLGEPIDATPLPVVVDPTAGAWPVPSVRSTVHPPVSAGDPLIDLTAAAVLPPAGKAAAPAPAMALGASGPLVLGKRRERLRDLLAREREELEQGASIVALPYPAPDVAPFPLPGVAPREAVSPLSPETSTAPLAPAVEQSGPRRVPKAVRPDAAGRPLAHDVAAAIARLADRTPALGVEPAERLGRHIEIIPLEELAPPPPAPMPALSEVIDLRERLAGAVSAAPAAPGTPRCPACNHPGELDVVDRANNLARYGCGHCFRIWSTPLA
jgi:hypothetical protein